jgi:hypothetical protein
MTTGFGVAAFYPEPQRPTYPITRIAPVPESCYKTPESQQSTECQRLIDGDAEQRQKEQAEYDRKNIEFENRNAGYTRTAIFLGILIGALYAIFGLAFIKKSQLVSNGFMLGAVLTALLTRLLIMLASFGSGVTGTEGANTLSYVEFAFLVLATVGVTVVGFKTLTEETSKKR